MKFFCLPADFKSETIDSYAELNSIYSHSKIIETYGQLAPDTIFGSCRNPKSLPQVDQKALEQYIKNCSEKNIDFNYVINVTCMGNEERTKAGYKKIKDFLGMLQDIGVNWVTITMPSIMEIASYVAPKLKIKASTVCLINSPVKAKFYETLGVSRIVLDEDIYRKFHVLKNIRQVYSGDIEVIINSFCLNGCPYKNFHYNSFSHINEEKDTYPYFGPRCKAIHMDPENYLKLNWIRPEDLHHYSEIGINFFKLQGRTNVFTGNPVKAVKHYIEESYDGDLISLLELFSPQRPLSIAGTKINNRSLDGFLNKFVRQPDSCTKVCHQCGYCKIHAEKSIHSTTSNTMELEKSINNILVDQFHTALETK